MPAIFISARWLLHGPFGEVTENGAVLVKEGLISACGPRANVEVACPRDAHRFDYPFGTILPGLIDSHVHLVLDASNDPVGHLAIGDAMALREMAFRASQLLGAGVTTVRDLGDRRGLALKLRQAVQDDVIEGPRILCSGSPLTSQGGHCSYLGGEVDSLADVRRHIRQSREDGCDVVKVMASGGRLTPSGPAPWRSQFDSTTMREIVRYATECSLPVAAHAHGTDSIAIAASVGVRTIEHCRWLTENGLNAPREIVEAILENDIFVSPTVNSNWEALETKLGARKSEQMLSIMTEHHHLGLRYIGGSDAGIPGIGFGDYSRGLISYLRIGLSPGEVIEAATARAADALGLTLQTGRVMVGLSADLMVVDGNPLSFLPALQSVQLVAVRGRIRQDRQVLDGSAEWVDRYVGPEPVRRSAPKAGGC